MSEGRRGTQKEEERETGDIERWKGAGSEK